MSVEQKQDQADSRCSPTRTGNEYWRSTCSPPFAWTVLSFPAWSNASPESSFISLPSLIVYRSPIRLSPTRPPREPLLLTARGSQRVLLRREGGEPWFRPVI